MLSHIRRRRILIAALAGAVFAALGITIASSHAAARTVHNGRIAVTHVSFRHECCAVAVDVLTMEPDGSDPQQLTHNDWGEASCGSRLGEGNWVYFDNGPVDDSSTVPDQRERTRADPDHARRRQRVRAAPSPNGTLIAFDGYFPDGRPRRSARHLPQRPERRQLPRLPAADRRPSAAASTPARHLAGRPHGRVPSRAQRLRAERGLRRLRRRHRWQRAPAAHSVFAECGSAALVARRKTCLVFSSNRDTDFGQQQIWVVNADGSDLSQLTHGAPGNPSFEPDWSPDGRQIVFAHFLPTGFFTQLRGDGRRRERRPRDLAGRRLQLRRPARLEHPTLTASQEERDMNSRILYALLAAAAYAAAAVSGGGAGTRADLPTSNLNTRAGKLTTLRAGVTYQASSFPARPSASHRPTRRGRARNGRQARTGGPHSAGPPLAKARRTSRRSAWSRSKPPTGRPQPSRRSSAVCERPGEARLSAPLLASRSPAYLPGRSTAASSADSATSRAQEARN